MGSEMVEYEWEYLSEYGSICRSMGVPFGVREYGSTGVREYRLKYLSFIEKCMFLHLSFHTSVLRYSGTPVLQWYSRTPVVLPDSERYSRTPILIQRFNQLFAFPNTLNSFLSAQNPIETRQTEYCHRRNLRELNTAKFIKYVLLQLDVC